MVGAAKDENLTTNFTAPHNFSTKSFIKDTVVLVSIGDSRGYVHLNHLYLK